MINYIYLDRSGHKKARPVKNRKEYFAIRNSEANVRNFEAARGGDKKFLTFASQFLMAKYSFRFLTGRAFLCPLLSR